MSLSSPKSVRGICSLIAAAWLAGCAGLRPIETPPRVSLVDLRPGVITVFEQRYSVRLRVLNPNDIPLEVRGMDYAIDINDQKFADGVSAEQFTVPPYGERVVEVTVTSSLLRLIEQFRQLDQRENLRLDYRISGRMSIAGSPTRHSFVHEDTLDLSPATAGGKAL